VAVGDRFFAVDHTVGDLGGEDIMEDFFLFLEAYNPDLPIALDFLKPTATTDTGVGNNDVPETPPVPPTPTALSVDVTPRGETVAYTSSDNFRTSSAWTPAVTGGVGPFTYEWQEGSGDDSRVITVSPAAQTTMFKTFYTKGCSLMVRVKVTDSTGATALSPYYRITFSKWP